MSALDVAIVRWTVWQLTLLARLIARLPLPWVLEQDAVALTAEERLTLVDLLGAWHAGRRSRVAARDRRLQSGKSARAP